ncbi:RagB/SusD family nutrient uptake outer membrane protein [Aridibaculum aurantiacum]|uniref:RagB/SusD family nutrient uptake outer membrane protein n=1 Tax=Aridibaculum aurantiacum TaxID=2810307 RepID=UPI001A97225C|nr:RagB/SusD family nutrient uptake outer membrane protein [Aridibaculum aurantiacum]
MKQNKLLYIILAAGMLAGCRKELDQVNPNQQTSESFWKTQDDAMKGVNAAYSSLLPDGGYMRCTPLMLDTRADDCRSNSPWDQMYNSGKFALQPGNDAIYGWAYETYYQGVFRCNQVLQHVPGIEMDQALKNRLLGQAYFLRGLYFYHLVNFWGNVPLPLTTASEIGSYKIPQSTPEQGWNQVISDFTKAAEMLPARYATLTGPDKGDLGRATKGAAMAFLGKAYLFNKKYTEAAAQFKAIMDMNLYSLVPNYRDNFTEVSENNSESLFEVQFSRDAGGRDLGWGGPPQPGWGKTSARAITYAPRGFGWTDVQPTRTVLNDFRLEKTVDNKVDPRLLSTIFYNDTVDTKLPTTPMYQTTFQAHYANNAADRNDLYCKKYQNYLGNRPDEFDWRSGINERIMRYADVLLMYAECLNEMGQTNAAYPIIQQVRSRVNLPNLATVKPNMTQAQMRDQLAHERLLEFSQEGHRFDDIRRWGWLQDPSKLALLKQRDPEFNTYAPGREYFPLPQREIDLNPGYKQNPGY